MLHRAAILLLVTGCTTVAGPRPADVSEPGGLASELHFPVHTMAFGEAEGSASARTYDPVEGVYVEGPRRPVTIGGNTGPIAWLHPLVYIMPSWQELSLRVGAFEPCELGGSAGYVRQGAEVRCGVTQRRWGDEVSTAISVGLTHRVDLYDLEMPDEGLGWRLGIEGSGPLDEQDDFRWMAGLWLSRGPHSHGSNDIPEDLDEASDLHVGPSLYLQRTETRLTVPVGLGIGDGPNGFLMGLSPYFTVDAGLVDYRCDQCSGVQIDQFTEGWGLTFVVGGYFASEGAVFHLSEPEARAGHHIEWKTDEAMILGGQITLGIGYLLPVIPNSVIAGVDERPYPWLTLIPAVGPTLVAAGVGEEPVATRVISGVGAAVQGVALLLWGMGWRGAPHQVPNEAGIEVVPYPGGGAVAGRF